MYTYRRQGRFYFQYVFPKVLAHRFKERAIRFSLLTYDRRYAKRLAQLHYLRCLELESKSFKTFAEVMAFVRDIGNVGSMKTLSELVGSSKDEALQAALKLLDSHSVPFYLEIDPVKATYGTVTDALASIVKPKDKTLVQIPYFTGQAKIALLDTNVPPSLFDTSKPYQVAHLHQLKVTNVPANVLALILAENTRSETSVVASAPMHPPLKLSEAYKEFAEFKRSGIDDPTLDEYRVAIDLFTDIHGDIDITELNTTKYNEYISLVRRMPPNRTKGTAKGKKIREIVDLGLPAIAPATLEKYHVRASTALYWIADTYKNRNIHITCRLPLDKNVKNTNTQRRPFSLEQLKTIHENEKAIQYLERQDEAYRLYLPVLALFTGARQNELAQLMLKDIGIDDDGTNFLSFNEDHSTQKIKGKGVKGNPKKTSIRRIPIHPMLIDELGFLKFVENRRKLLDNKPDELLFQGLAYDKKNGYARNISRFFNDRLLEHLGITEKEYVFHSYRYTVVEKLVLASLANKLNADIKNIYLGHDTKDQSENVKTYFSNKKPAMLKPVLEHITFDIDWTRYKALLDRFNN